MKLFRPEHISMVGNGHGLHAIINRLLQQLGNIGGPIQDGELGVHMQMTECKLFRGWSCAVCAGVVWG